MRVSPVVRFRKHPETYDIPQGPILCLAIDGDYRWVTAAAGRFLHLSKDHGFSRETVLGLPGRSECRMGAGNLFRLCGGHMTGKQTRCEAPPLANIFNSKLMRDCNRMWLHEPARAARSRA
jgi:hypothetical protein